MISSQPHETILNVDDHDAARYAKTRVLEDSGFEVVDAANGFDAMALAIEKQPDVVLLDVRLPGIDGFEVCRRLRADPRTRSTIIIHTSASFTGTDDRVRGLDGGADAYLTSPADPRILVATVRTLLRTRRAELALRASEARFRRMADAAPVMIWSIDADRREYWFNRRWFEFCGEEAAGANSGDWQERIHPEDRARASSSFEEAFTERREFEIEFRLRRSDGAYRWILDRGVPMTDDSGRSSGFIGSCIDIDDFHALDERRRRLLEEERTARIEGERLNNVKDEFLAILSHELRTPLNAIHSWIHILRNHAADEMVRAEGLDAIARNSRAQVQLIDDLLDVSRISSGKLKVELAPLALIDVINDTIAQIQPSATKKSIQITTRLDPGANSIHGDRPRLQQVMSNLLSNAVKFTPDGGRISVELRSLGPSCEIVVQDDGFGIHPEFLPFVFEKFRQGDSTTTRRHGGLGLGLAIVRKIVELHGGRVSAESEGEGRGATFRVELPLVFMARGEESSAGDSETASELPSLRGFRVLVIDDESDGREAVSRLLADCEASVSVAEGVERAIALLEREKIDVVVSDIGMPQFDGYNLIRRLRGDPRTRSLPVIALTALARADDRSRVLSAGFRSYISKPFELNELVREIQRLGRRPQSPEGRTSP